MRIEVYKDKKREHRWRMVAGNGRIIAESGEGYKNHADMWNTLSTVRTAIGKTEIVEIDEVTIKEDDSQVS